MTTSTQTEVKHVGLYINGEYVPASNNETFNVTNPATQEVIAHVSEATDEDVDNAIRAAREAFNNGPWSKMTVEERSAKLRRMAEIIVERGEEIARLDATDVGKPYASALKGEVPRAANNIRFFADFMEQKGGETYPMGESYVNYTRYEPVGVATLITPWNVPFMLTTWKLGPCLAAGNTAVIKPAENTPLSVSLLGEIAKEAGIPDGVVNVVHGKGSTVGTALTKHPEVDLVSFTGSTRTGSSIMKSAADTLKNVSFELGGKAANIIFEDADLEKAIPGSIRAAFFNSGQVCLAGSRILVQRSILDDFMNKFTEAAKNLKVGDPNVEGTDMGPLVSEAHYNKVVSYFDVAKEEGAKLVYGGKRPDNLPEHLKNGFYLEPTIYIAEDPNSRMNQEEIFGPVVTIIPFDTEEEAIEIANATNFGLDGVLWTENLRRAHRVSHAFQAGTVWVNCWFVRDLRAPFGGYKQSGVGREGGHHSLEFFTEAKNICIAL
ncbi:5-carboxymethyl-2-hydroxymuconate semialdehyde dehydrogenase [Oceanobacillus arenosus]|uniref:5-carboxymethyl-2-hydroxymuconate semialdehyde dehydrogenase n=1 Tax=Oceanobacillus arenosus TaxID=1229153 RepID=A0A3D8PXS5_9BACI|nr:aldehyde dehydrogenase [Oceanobacillus arenosus]RDW20121.1 5-carboxymethyl-2-hydroxymuconate semialdehyde dehydrogenase [Oceanobacillus arenosus]